MVVNLCQISNFALNDITLEVRAAELLVIVGPSGAGKTTLLSVLAGLVPYRGQVTFNGIPADHLPPHKRRVGYVFQDLLLFPHLTVKKNLLLAMRHLGLTRRERHALAHEILNLLRVGGLSDRLPSELSGGERQRVALARALACRPRILLLDEPFASLDFRTARYLRQEFRRLQRHLALSTLFVTHNLREAQELGDRIAVLRKGRLEQILGADEMPFNMRGESGYLERPNLLPCEEMVNLGNGLVQVEWAGLKILAPDEDREFTHLAILPREVFISPLPPPGPPINRFLGTVKSMRENDGVVQVTVKLGTETLCAEISPDHLAAMRLEPGHQVHGILKLRALRGWKLPPKQEGVS